MPPIRTQRLDLPLLSESFLDATSAGHWRRATALLEAEIPGEWWQERELARMRLNDLRRDPAYRLWSLRAMIERPARRMVGFCGFHTPPNPAYLRPWAEDAVEMGYSVFPESRGRGYATEATAGLMRWASRRPEVRRFVLSIAPGNAASLAVARKLGFVYTAIHHDPADGAEQIHVAEARRPGLRELLRTLASTALGG